LGVLIYFTFPIVKNRYFEDKSENENKETSSTANTITDNIGKKSETANDDTANNNDADDAENLDSNGEAKDETDESGDIGNISAKDCDNECANFRDNPADLRYCQDICDLSPIKDSDNCESKQGSDKDYCFKNQAVLKTDLAVCDSIIDAKIKSSCKNRVTEDILEKQL